MIEYKETKVSIQDLKVGDTVLINGEPKTVGRDAVRDGFTGTTLWGDPHHATGGKVSIRLYPRFYRNSFIGWFSQ